jgi:hypothetical protein
MIRPTVGDNLQDSPPARTLLWASAEVEATDSDTAAMNVAMIDRRMDVPRH